MIVGEEKELYKKELLVEDANILLLKELKEPLRVMTKTRYSAREFASTIYPTKDGKIKVVFDEPQRAITPGQSAVFYIDDILVRWRENNLNDFRDDSRDCPSFVPKGHKGTATES